MPFMQLLKQTDLVEISTTSMTAADGSYVAATEHKFSPVITEMIVDLFQQVPLL